MKVLVTGSAGFIGGHLVRALADRGYSVVATDLGGSGGPGEAPSFRPCDITDKEGLNRLFAESQPEALIHLAARTDLLGETIEDYAANTVGVENLIDAIRNTRTVRRAVFTSSQLVCRVGYVPQHDQDYQPNTIYGQSKVLTEQIVRGTNGGGAEWCLVRPTTVWGPGMNKHYQSFFRLIRQGRYFHVGRRPLYKTYGYVGNVVEQYIRLLEAPSGSLREVFYVADYEPLALREWADALQREFGVKPIRTVSEPLARALARTGDLLNAVGVRRFPFNSFRLNNILTEYRYDMSPTRAVCGEMTHTFEEGVRETAAWFSAVDSQSSSNGK
ncbi:MAG TPA: NAD(P)-dependent oxidoreductase [Pyrinomonadaceae bacterium]|nr:NAD(P)-dependent oxidoreductase [Pyrinomonadaceae bacterium]